MRQSIPRPARRCGGPGRRSQDHRLGHIAALELVAPSLSTALPDVRRSPGFWPLARRAQHGDSRRCA